MASNGPRNMAEATKMVAEHVHGYMHSTSVEEAFSVSGMTEAQAARLDRAWEEIQNKIGNMVKQ